MIFNAKETIKVLEKYLYRANLTEKEFRTIRTLICYLDMQEPKITLEEFNELFKIEKKRITNDVVELDVIPKNKIYLQVADGRLINDIMNISVDDIQEHIQLLAYNEFYKILDKLEELENDK